jgi:hypothetical protein
LADLILGPVAAQVESTPERSASFFAFRFSVERLLAEKPASQASKLRSSRAKLRR